MDVFYVVVYCTSTLVGIGGLVLSYLSFRRSGQARGAAREARDASETTRMAVYARPLPPSPPVQPPE